MTRQHEESATTSRLGRRNLIIGGVLVALLLVAGTWALAVAFVSPQQLEAAASPPSPKPVLAEVTRGDLDDVRVVAGVVGYLGERTVPLTPQEGATRSVVTRVGAGAGASVTAGAAVLAINDQPVFAIDSPFPFYRDLGPGDSGADVRALQKTLVAAGLLGAEDGKFGSRTQAAVVALFKREGVSPPTRETTSQTPPTTPEGDASSKSAASTQTPAKSEPYLPLSSVVAISGLPAVLQSVPAVGDIVDATSSVVVSNVSLVARGPVPSGVDVSQLDGTTVTGQIEGFGEFSGTLSQGLAAPPTLTGADPTDDTATPEVPSPTTEVVATPSAATPLSPEMVGRAATLSFSLAVLADNELIVPSSAVADDESGKGAVLVQQEDGSFLRTKVEIIGSLGGRVAIRVDDDTIVEGDKVRVG